jgi:uncharacterized protein YeaO (DUF488 family)
MKTEIKLKRVYEKPEKGDGMRILVERLWPRGLSKEKACIDFWAKDVAPSTALRQWFSHDPKKWDEFQRRYNEELKNNKALEELRKKIKGKTVTFVFAASNEKQNSAVVLKEILEE